MKYSSTLIPDYIKALSPDGLRRLMFLKNTKDGKQYIFQNPQYVVEGKTAYWIVWYYRDIDANVSADLTNILKDESVKNVKSTPQ